MYDEGSNVINMNVKMNQNMSDEHDRYLSIAKYNWSPGLPHWGYKNEEDNRTNPE